MSEAMQLQADLMLEKAVTKARQADEVKRHQGVIRGIDDTIKNESEVDYVHRKGGNRQNKTGFKQHYKERTNENTTIKKCSRCGRAPQHAFVVCPAKQSACNNCIKKGHWEAVCTWKKKKINEVSSKESTQEEKECRSRFSICG